MGNSESQTNKNILEKYTTIRQVEDLQFGECQLVEDKETKKIFILKEYLVTQEKDFADFQQELSKRAFMIHENIVQLMGFTALSQKDLCSNSYKNFAIFEYCQLNCQQIMDKKIQEKETFSQDELWNILTDSLKALYFLQKSDTCHGDIRPCNILLSNDKYKLADTSFFNKQSSYLDVLGHNKEDQQIQKQNFFSPALMAALKSNEYVPNHNKFKSDAFALGLTLLSLATLDNLQDCYCFDTFQVSQSQINEKIQGLNYIYSDLFVEFLKKLIQFDEQERSDYKSLNDQLEERNSQKINIEDIAQQHTQSRKSHRQSVNSTAQFDSIVQDYAQLKQTKIPIIVNESKFQNVDNNYNRQSYISNNSNIQQYSSNYQQNQSDQRQAFKYSPINSQLNSQRNSYNRLSVTTQDSTYSQKPRFGTDFRINSQTGAPKQDIIEKNIFINQYQINKNDFSSSPMQNDDQIEQIRKSYKNMDPNFVLRHKVVKNNVDDLLKKYEEKCMMTVDEKDSPFNKKYQIQKGDQISYQNTSDNQINKYIDQNKVLLKSSQTNFSEIE